MNPGSRYATGMRFAYLALVSLAGCGLSLDLAPPEPDRRDGSMARDGGLRDGAAADGPSGDAPSADATIDAFTRPDAGTCATDVDCEGRPRSGADTACAPWRCEDGFCRENDLDGDGFGPGCPDDRDCDDEDPSVTVDGVVRCDDAPPGVCGASAYRECRDGIVASGPCEGIVPPLRAEVCNGEDDDCDGLVDDAIPTETVGAGRCAATLACVDGAWGTSDPMPAEVDGCEGASEGVDDDCDGRVDEDCVPTDCIYVRPGGTGDGTAAAPVPNVNAAFAAAEAGGVDTICLLANSGPSGCATTTFPMPNVPVPGSLTVVGGLAVLAGSAAGTVSRCPSGPEATALVPAGWQGIVVGAGVTLSLRDLVVNHPAASGSSAVALDVTDGATLLLSNVRVRGGDAAGEVTIRRGVRVASGGSLVATTSRIEAGPGSTAHAIDSTGGDVRILAGCGPLGCTPVSCAEDRTRGVVSTRPGSTVRLNGGSFFADRATLCSDNGSHALLVQGRANVTLLRSFVEVGATPADEAFGVRVASCSSFWMHDTTVRLAAAGADRTYDSLVGVNVEGGCAAQLTQNVVEGVRTPVSTPEVLEAVGVRCVDSDCFVVDNQITASAGNGTLAATALSCAAGCGYVAQNLLTGALVDADESIGLSVVESDAMVTGNRTVGGCGELVVGARVLDGAPRFTSNEVIGSQCSAPPMFAAGLAVERSSESSFSSNGNSYDGGLVVADSPCSAAGAVLTSTTPLGTFRNDLFVAGECSFARAFIVDDAAPALFTHNGFIGDYYDAREDLAYGTPDALRAAYPLFVDHVFTDERVFADRPLTLRIVESSALTRRGTSRAAPLRDRGGVARPRPPSIGAWEP